MNRIFKTKWSDAHQQYVVTNETQAGRGKKTKSAVTVAVAAALFSGMAVAATMPVDTIHGYDNDPGVIGNQQSWETAEYMKDWGLKAMHASKAYSLGFNGSGTTVAVMDSGALLQKHPELAGDRFTATHVTGEYGSTGNHYQTDAHGVGDDFNNGGYQKGDKFDVDGNFVGHVNDTHGTHVTGTVGANRDGNEFHGVAWGSDIVVGNSGATDNNNYGPFQDYNFYYAGWSALADRLVADNGKLADGSNRGGVINNSFGTNLRVYTNGTQTSIDSLPVNNIQETEYEYFLFKQEDCRFVDAAWDAIKGKNVVQIFTTGNRDMLNPYYRPLYPYFNPEAESQWIAVTGIKKAGVDANGDPTYKYWNGVNKAGDAKWWTIAAPGAGIYSSIAYDDHYCKTDSEHKLGEPGYDTFGGTSMAAPHVAGAMGVMMDRYSEMNALQVRDVMFTTANHKNHDGSNFVDWTAAEGTPDELYGWGVPDLDKGMFGPGQFLTHFNYAMRAGSLDVWTNDISQVALDARKAEDDAWMKHTNNGTDLTADDLKLDSEFGIPNIENSAISKEDALKYRQEYYQKRADDIQAKRDGGLYDGKLVKSGEGTLVVTGNNTYRGGTVVEDGMLVGFNDSFGVTGEDGTAQANGLVTVNGGTFGIITSYNDQLTQKGEILDKVNDHSVDVTVAEKGSLAIMAGHDAEMGNLVLGEGAKVTVASLDGSDLKKVYQGEALTGSLTADKIEGNVIESQTDLAFFKNTVAVNDEKTTITGTLERDESKSFATYADTHNASKIAGALESAATGALFEKMLGFTADEVSSTYAALGNDVYLNSQNAGIVNGLTMSRAVKDQAAGIGEGRSVEMKNGTARLWMTGVGSWTNLDYGMSDMDSDFYAGLVGAEIDVLDSTKLGLFFGAGKTDNDAGAAGKVKSDDIHFGAYGVTEFGVTQVNFGVMHTHQDAESARILNIGNTVGINETDTEADITQVYVEAACKALNTEAYSVEPYAGLNWIHAENDGFSEKVGDMTFTTDSKDRDMQIATLGVRAAVPFTIGKIGMNVMGDVAWNHFFGDTSSEAAMNLAGSGIATIEGGELEDMATVGLGVEAQLTKSTTFGLSYTGAYDSDVTSHGVYANVRMNF